MLNTQPEGVMMKIAVIGAGLAGLTAASILSEYADVVVYEKEVEGGLASSWHTEKGYWIEKFYHHCFRGDKELLEQIKRYKLTNKLVWKVARVGFAHEDRIYPLNTPLEILKYPYLSFTDKIKLALFTYKSRRRNYKEFDEKGVVEGIREEIGESVLNEFFMPLLRSKFGENHGEVSYAWLLARVSIRSNRKYSGEELGYMRGGFQQLVEKMTEGLNIQYERASLKVGGGLIVNGRDYDAVVFTSPLSELDGTVRKAAGIAEIKYQSSVCALIGAEGKVTEDIYWTNIRDRRVFGAMIEHTNFMPVKDYGEELIYLASYTTPDGWLYNTPDEDLKKLYLKDLKKYGFNEGDLNWIEIFRAKYSGPIFEKGYLKKLTDYRTLLKNLYIAGMTSPPNYPERSMNGSIKAGKEVAEVIKKDFGFE
jgi:protoporphyrinogen oxidase